MTERSAEYVPPDVCVAGGRDHQDLDQAALPNLTSGTAVSDSSGTLSPSTSNASSYAQAQSVCAFPSAAGCTVAAQLVRSVSNSAADATSASSNAGDSQLVGVTVSGTTVPVNASPNQRVDIPGVGFVILNEQFCDNNASLAARCAGAGHAGLTVRAIHVFVTVPTNPLGLIASPLENVVSRRFEAEADWLALRGARDPAAQVALFRDFTRTSLEEPDPSLADYILFENHPTIMQRIAMVEAQTRR